MVVADPGTVMTDPNAWQPLSLGIQIAQNGLPIPGNVQSFIGPHWGFVTPFALEPSPTGTPIDPGPPPHLGEPETDARVQAGGGRCDALQLGLDPADGELIDISPSASR